MVPHCYQHRLGAIYLIFLRRLGLFTWTVPYIDSDCCKPCQLQAADADIKAKEGSIEALDNQALHTVGQTTGQTCLILQLTVLAVLNMV